MTGVLAFQYINNLPSAFPKFQAQINHAALFPSAAIIAPATDDPLPNITDEVTPIVRVTSPPANPTILSSVLCAAADLSSLAICPCSITRAKPLVAPSLPERILSYDHDDEDGGLVLAPIPFSSTDNPAHSLGLTGSPVLFPSRLMSTSSVLDALPDRISSSDDNKDNPCISSSDDNKDNPRLSVRCSFRPMLRGFFRDDPPDSLVSSSEAQVHANHPHGIPPSPFHIRHHGETLRSPVRRRRRRNSRIL